MGLIGDILAFAVNIFLLLLFVRVVFDWIQVFAREWRPRGIALVVAEATYTSPTHPCGPCPA